MACEVHDDGKGGRFIVCSKTRPGSRTACPWCGKVGSPFLCDGEPPAGAHRKTCDAPMCGDCRTNVGPDRDFCPRCDMEAEMKKRGGPAKPVQQVLAGALPSAPAPADSPRTHAPKTCRCGAPIYWGQIRETGKSISVNAEPDPSGTIILHDYFGSVLVKVIPIDQPVPGAGKRRTRHICPTP